MAMDQDWDFVKEPERCVEVCVGVRVAVSVAVRVAVCVGTLSKSPNGVLKSVVQCVL